LVLFVPTNLMRNGTLNCVSRSPQTRSSF